MGQGRSRLRRIAAQPVFGRCLNQRRHRVTASDTRRQRVVGIAWVERGRLLVAAQGLFKLSINEELARGKIELGSPPPVGVARQFGLSGVLSWSGVLTLPVAIVRSRAATVAGKFFRAADRDLSPGIKSIRLAGAFAPERCSSASSPGVSAACLTCLDFADWTRAS
jgi:hypothetical protein